MYNTDKILWLFTSTNKILCSYYVVRHHAEIKEARVCVWEVTNIALVDTIIYYNMRKVTIMAEICRRHTTFVTIRYFLLLRTFYVTLTVHFGSVLANIQLDAQFFFSYIFIPILYIFRAPLCSSSGESIVLMWNLVYVTLCRWPSSVQCALHTRRSPT